MLTSKQIKILRPLLLSADVTSRLHTTGPTKSEVRICDVIELHLRDKWTAKSFLIKDNV